MSDLSRRRFLVSSFLGAGALTWIRDLPARVEESVEIWTGISRDALEAAMSRIIPSDDGPGATEAECAVFVLRILAHEDSPYRETYRLGLMGLDEISQAFFGKEFVAVDPAKQDGVLRAVESGEVPRWPDGEVEPKDFFAVLRTHTVWAFLADPKYGGNRHYVGWKLAGYPGSGHPRGVRPKQLTGEVDVLPIWDPRY